MPSRFCYLAKNGASTVEAMNLVGGVEGEILLVDDMTETAGTLTAAAKLLKESCPKGSAIVSHCVLNETGHERLMNGMLDELITTNSVGMDYGELLSNS